jgi:hypothetical protein
MTEQHHDYSRHELYELESESFNLDPAKHPGRSKSLQIELIKRLQHASASAAVAKSHRALSVGARYAELDRAAARRFLWPFLGFSFLFSFVVGFIVAFIASFATGVLASFGAFEAQSLTARTVRFGFTLLLAVPVAIAWLKFFTSRSFGGYGLRIIEAGARDAA